MVTLPKGLRVRSGYEINDSDLYKIVEDYYGKPFNFQQANMLANETYTEHEVSSTEWDYGEEQLAEWLAISYPCITCEEVIRRMNTEWYKSDGWFHRIHFEREHSADLEVILWDLCRNNIIPEGYYQIKVSW